MSPELFAATLAIAGLVIVVSTLLSGAIDRAGVPHAAVFLLLGLVLGPYGTGLIDVTLDSPILRAVATLSLALVLFTDAVGLDLAEVRRHGRLALRVLGPGTILTAAAVGTLGWALLGLSPAAAAIVGAALASTDPVLLRGFLRRRDLPESARIGLRLESGLNDVVLLPIVLAAMPFLEGAEPPRWGSLALHVLVLGPLAGLLVGFVAVSALEKIRRGPGVRRDYESLYSLGVAFGAFAIAESFHGSGFLAAFTAGITVVALDHELCDCFVEYGETTAEMLLLFTFVLFGASLLWTGLLELDWQTVLFAGLVLAIRPLIFLPSIGRAMDPHARRLVAWFGPRGLSTLLLVLLPVFAGIPGSDRLFHVCAVVVIASVLAHGTTLVILSRRRGAAPASVPAGATTTMAGVPAEPSDAPSAAAAPSERITIDEVHALRDGHEPHVLVDVRADRDARGSQHQAAGAVRVHPDHALADARAAELPRDATLILYCA